MEIMPPTFYIAIATAIGYVVAIPWFLSDAKRIVREYHEKKMKIETELADSKQALDSAKAEDPIDEEKLNKAQLRYNKAKAAYKAFFDF
jgi:hypothetical protein